MNNKYESVIGLEVHVELNTKSKMFCRCSADYFGKAPNSNTCPVCLGLPGALPYINKEAIQDCIKIGLALNCSVPEKALFERKNYFYPDLAKGYQISQYRWPQTVNGWIDVEDDQGNISRIRINRAHQEEDTGKLTHSGVDTLIDFNRSSVPLVEIVTEPDFRDSSQIRDYAKKLQQLFRYLGVSNADMERGDMRLEANVSVRKLDDGGERDENGYLDQKYWPPYRVELKNINSFRFMVAAVEYEIKRQIELYESDREDELKQETRGWNEDKKETFLQRSKEEANDYRYFPDPDLPEMTMPSRDLDLEKLKEELQELPWQKEKRFTGLGISQNNSKILVEDKNVASNFEKLLEVGKELDPQKIANFVVNQKIDLLTTDPSQIIKSVSDKGSNLITDDVEIEKLCRESIEENPQSVADYRAGKLNALQALLGSVMRKSQGKADPSKTGEILEKLLS